MIISHIIGGIGNQMFQFAAGRALALEKARDLKLDTSGFARYGLHQGFQLQHAFRGEFNVASDSETKAILGWQRAPLAQSILSRQSMAPFRKRGWIVEPHFHYWDGIRQASTDSYLKGYWQSEKYFQKHEESLRTDFSFKSPLSDENSLLAGNMRQINSVSLHVRRGDYVKNSATSAVHGLCTLEYYHAAVRHILRRVDHPVFFVFSDDMPWVKANLVLAAPTHHVDHNAHSYDDLHLMSLCKHHVIANSSFSWWGAWLSTTPDKIVVAPRQWFARPRNTDDLIPPAWVTI